MFDKREIEGRDDSRGDSLVTESSAWWFWKAFEGCISAEKIDGRDVSYALSEGLHMLRLMLCVSWYIC